MTNSKVSIYKDNILYCYDDVLGAIFAQKNI